MALEKPIQLVYVKPLTTVHSLVTFACHILTSHRQIRIRRTTADRVTERACYASWEMQARRRRWRHRWGCSSVGCEGMTFMQVLLRPEKPDRVPAPTMRMTEWWKARSASWRPMSFSGGSLCWAQQESRREAWQRVRSKGSVAMQPWLLLWPRQHRQNAPPYTISRSGSQSWERIHLMQLHGAMAGMLASSGDPNPFETSSLSSLYSRKKWSSCP